MPPPPTAAELWPSRRTRGLIKRGSVAGWQRQWRAIEAKALAQVGRTLLARSEKKERRRVRLEPAIEAVIADANVTRLIGRPELAVAGDDGPWPDLEAPSWITVCEGDPFPSVRIGFRGALISTVFHRELGDEDNRVLKVERTVSERLYSLDALREAAEAARDALRRAGFPLSAHARVEQMHGGQSAVASIWLRSLSPTRARGPSMAP